MTGTGVGPSADPDVAHVERLTSRDNVRGRPRIFRGWKVAGAGSVLLALQGALLLQAFGNYAVILREQFGWSKTTISIAYAFNRAESGLLGPAHGWALQRFGPRSVMRVGAVIVFVGFVWFSQMSSPVHFVLSFVTVSIGASLGGFLTIATETVKWFERRRARALSVAAVGVAAGGLVVPAVVQAMNTFGWRATAFTSGVVLAGAMLALSRLFGSTPGELGEPIDGIELPPTSDGRVAVRDVEWHFTAREALATRAFWLLALGHACAMLVVGSVLAHLSLYLTSEQGFSLLGASFVMAAVPMAQILGMFIGGALGDRTSKRWLCSIAMMGHVSGLLMLTLASNSWMIWAFVVLHGLAWGTRGPLMSAIRADYFGATSFGQIMGYSSLVIIVGAVGGPLFAGAAADITGSYRLGFILIALLAATGSALFALAAPPTPPPRTATPIDG